MNDNRAVTAARRAAASALLLFLPLSTLALVNSSDHAKPDTLTHVTADMAGIGSGPLRDAALLSGLLIAAASAAGLNPQGAPHVRVAPTGGVSALLFLDPCHVSIHSLPDRNLALVDILTRDAAGAAKALDVFVRRLVPAAVTSDARTRG
jgi:S-adenosylmethionine/arginine decarboxylase-like enzyme